MKKQYIDFKDGVNNLDLLFISPWLMLVLADMSLYCHVNCLPFKITSLIRSEEQELAVKARSRTHKEGRAADISLDNWTQEQAKGFEVYFSRKYEDFAAISKTTQEPRLIYIHNNGHGKHAHVQVRSLQ